MFVFDKALFYNIVILACVCIDDFFPLSAAMVFLCCYCCYYINRTANDKMHGSYVEVCVIVFLFYGSVPFKDNSF